MTAAGQLGRVVLPGSGLGVEPADAGLAGAMTVHREHGGPRCVASVGHEQVRRDRHGVLGVEDEARPLEALAGHHVGDLDLGRDQLGPRRERPVETLREPPAPRLQRGAVVVGSGSDSSVTMRRVTTWNHGEKFRWRVVGSLTPAVPRCRFVAARDPRHRAPRARPRCHIAPTRCGRAPWWSPLGPCGTLEPWQS